MWHFRPLNNAECRKFWMRKLNAMRLFRASSAALMPLKLILLERMPNNRFTFDLLRLEVFSVVFALRKLYLGCEIQLCQNLSPKDSHSWKLRKFKKIWRDCISWTNKSATGLKEWMEACSYVNVSPRLIPTPVKTRFFIVLVMFRMML